MVLAFLLVLSILIAAALSVLGTKTAYPFLSRRLLGVLDKFSRESSDAISALCARQRRNGNSFYRPKREIFEISVTLQSRF